jgi:hypothetical protein
LLIEFKEIHGSAPLANRQMERRKTEHTYAPIDDIRSALMIGRGIRYEWAIKPMKSSSMFKRYKQTAGFLK